MTMTAMLRRTGRMVNIIAPRETLDRLNGTCFRGKTSRWAGNFSRWNSLGVMLRDPQILDGLLENIEDSLPDKKGTFSFTITYPLPVGWESTAPRKDFPEEFLERFRPGKGKVERTALRVKPELKGIRAPKTHDITFIFNLMEEESRLLVFLRSVYPGHDIGELVGDITEREGRVFYDFKQPGA